MSRTYVVTGSASGIGKATKTLLEERNNKVIGVDIKGADIEADLSTPAGREFMVSRATELSGGVVDGLLAVAGLSAPEPLTARVNYFGSVATLKGIRPLLAKSAAPRAVAVASLAAIWQQDDDLLAAFEADDETRAMEIAERIKGGDPGGPIYFTAKRALSYWVRRHAPTAEWAGAGIALNVISPGTIVTPMTAHSLVDEETTKATMEFIPMPLNGVAQPVVVARLLAWLTSEENTHLCGQVIYIDGGAEAIERGASAM